MSTARKNTIIIVAISVLVVGVVLLFNLRSPEPPIPVSITKQTAFTVLQPDQTLYSIKKQTTKYDSAQGILSFETTGSNAVFTVSEQPIPDSFNDAPQIYPALLNKMHQYSEITTKAGTVTLTHPDELKGGQTAVLRSNRGALIFVRPDRNLSDSEWKDFFNSLIAV